MANLISRVTGNWLTAATWGLVDTTSYLNSQAASSTVPTSGGSTARSAGFTPGAITIDGIAIKLATRTGTTGTLTVELWNNTGSAVVAATTVTINTADLENALSTEADGGWIIFDFASVLLLAATEYMVQCTTSSSSQIDLRTNATANNWARMLRTTTTQAPAAGDDMVVAGEYTGAGTSNSFTVTMNSTSATDYGSAVADGSSITPALAVCAKGTLTNGATAATNYILRLSGNLANFRGATINIGTVGTPIPRDSTAVVEFDCVADADFGWHNHGGTCNIQGLSRTVGKNVVSCKLNTDEAVAQTVLGVDTDTGWLSGDQIAIASTTQTIGQSELRTLSANANAADMTVTAGLTDAHSGTSPTQAEVINLTRNVKIRSVSSTAMTFFHCNPTAIIDADWAEFSFMGEDAIADWRGVTVMTTTGSFNMQFCSLHDFEDWGFYVISTIAEVQNITFAFNVLWDVAKLIGAGGFIDNNAVAANVVIDSNIIIKAGDNSAVFAGWSLRDLNITFTNNTVVSSRLYGVVYEQAAGTFGVFSGNTYHSNENGGVRFAGTGVNGTINTLTLWRNGGVGAVFYHSEDVTINTLIAFGNAGSNIKILDLGYLRLNGFVSNGDTNNGTTFGIEFTEDLVSGLLTLDNCNFSTVSGIKTAHGNDMNCSLRGTTRVIARNTILNGDVEVADQSNMRTGGFVSSAKHEQTAGNHKTWLRYGTLSTDTTIFNTASPSMRMTPISATGKLESAPLFQGLKVAVNNSGTVTVSVWTRKSTSYNGAQPRLIVKANPALGASFNSDTVLDTHTAAVDTWEQLSGTTAAVTDDGICEFVVDCDGTAGFVNVDDWSKT
jgi:hypothetical protein